MNAVCSRRVSLLLSPILPTLLSPTTPPPQPRHFAPLTLWLCSGPPAIGPCLLSGAEGLLPLGSWPGLRSGLAGSPVGVAESGSRCFMFVSRCYGRVVHLRQLSTPCCHDAVAFGFRRVNVPPDGDFHPAVWAPLQAHESRLQPAALPPCRAAFKLLNVILVSCASPPEGGTRAPAKASIQRGESPRQAERSPA